jgi:hypothetical protein
MDDTPEHIERRFRELMMARSPVDRLKMACDMFTTAKTLALAGIAQEAKDATPAEVRKLLFIRMYGQDFSPRQRAKIAAHIEAT